MRRRAGVGGHSALGAGGLQGRREERRVRLVGGTGDGLHVPRKAGRGLLRLAHAKPNPHFYAVPHIHQAKGAGHGSVRFTGPQLPGLLRQQLGVDQGQQAGLDLGDQLVELLLQLLSGSLGWSFLR